MDWRDLLWYCSGSGKLPSADWHYAYDSWKSWIYHGLLYFTGSHIWTVFSQKMWDIGVDWCHSGSDRTVFSVYRWESYHWQRRYYGIFVCYRFCHNRRVTSYPHSVRPLKEWRTRTDHALPAREPPGEKSIKNSRSSLWISSFDNHICARSCGKKWSDAYMLYSRNEERDEAWKSAFRLNQSFYGTGKRAL